MSFCIFTTWRKKHNILAIAWYVQTQLDADVLRNNIEIGLINQRMVNDMEKREKTIVST